MSSDSELKTGSFSGATGRVFELKMDSGSEFNTGSFSDPVGPVSEHRGVLFRAPTLSQESSFLRPFRTPLSCCNRASVLRPSLQSAI